MKEKIVDCIIFNEKLNFLNFRINEVINLVDIIYVVFHGEEKKSELLSDNFHFKDNNKVRILEFHSEIVDGFAEVKELLLNEKLNFDDIISISNVNELPNYKKYYELTDILPFSLIVSLQKKYTWSLDYIDTKLHKGTKIFYFTNFLKYNTLYSNVSEKKLCEPLFEFYENGWSFFGFDTTDSESKSNLLPIDNIDKFKTNILIKSSEDKNFINIYNYIGHSTIKLRDKKLFYVGDVETESYYDERMIFQKINKLSFDSDFNQIFVPNYLIYDSNNFQIEYFLNEVKKYMSILFILPHDEIIFNFNFMKEQKRVLWKDVESNNILSLLLD